MRNLLVGSVLGLSLLSSCVSTQVSSANNYNFSVLKPNGRYTVETKDGAKISGFRYNQQNETQLIGKDEEKEMNIEKSNINKVVKFSAGKTIPLVVGIIGAAILVPAFVKNKPVGQ